MRLGPETREQIALFDWIRLRPDIEPYAWHVANERRTSISSGRLLKRMGVKPGVSDVMVAIPSGGYHGLFLELKAGKGKPTEAQKNFLANVTLQGYLGICVTGFEAAKAAIESYLSLP